MSGTHDQLKRRISAKLMNVFFWGCILGFPLVAISLAVALVVPFLGATPADKVLSAKLTFTSLGLLFAIFEIFLGVLMALIGITIDYDVDAAMGPAKLKLASASPGVLIVLVGNFLFAFALMRQFEVSQAEQSIPTSRGQAASDGQRDGKLAVPAIEGANGPE